MGGSSLPGLGKGLPAAAGKQFVNWAEFVVTESHGRSPVVLGEVRKGFVLERPSSEQDQTQTAAAAQFVFDRIAMGWESRSNCRISETLSCAAISLHTRSTHSVVDKANGACLSPDRERLRAGT